MKKMSVFGRAAAVVVVAACVVDLGRAAEPLSSGDEAAIRQAAADYLDARNAATLTPSWPTGPRTEISLTRRGTRSTFARFPAPPVRQAKTRSLPLN